MYKRSTVQQGQGRSNYPKRLSLEVPNMDLITQPNKSFELDASQANLVWSYFPESKSTEKDKFPFSFAPIQVHFSNLKHELQIYHSIPEHKDISKIGLNALIALAINDFASSAGNSSGMSLPTPNVKQMSLLR